MPTARRLNFERRPQLSANRGLVYAAGPAANLATLTPPQDASLLVENIRFDAVTGRYAAELRLQNGQAALGRDAVVAFPGLPAGVTLLDADLRFA